jgi:RimJ/RimL family protein N-acetyltransferase
LLITEYYPLRPYPVTSEGLSAPDKCYFWAYCYSCSPTEPIGITGFQKKTTTLVETVKTIVFEKYRGKGLGKKLSQAIEDYCLAQGTTKIMSTIYAQNTAMIAIKLEQGYTIEGYHPDHEAPGWHEYSLGKVFKR